MIFDFDDAVFVAYVSPSNGYLSYLKFPAKTKTICRLATHVIAGNPYLADYARQTNDNVSIVPTTIDTDKYEVLPRKENELPVIGWSGSFSTVQHLDSLAGALRRLARKENFRLLVIGTPVYKIDGVDVEALPWRSATEVSDLRQIDIGIMPLPDEAWSRGKCGLKALQYMALGIPTVCSPVGVNSEIIQDSVNGFLAGTEDEWVAKLTQLLNDSKLRARLGAAGRETVETKYSAAVQAPRVYEILHSVVATPRGESTSRVSGKGFQQKGRPGNMNILVTGGAGFIGSHLVDALIERGHRVRVLDALVSQVHEGEEPLNLNPQAEFVRGDVCDSDVLNRALGRHGSCLS